MAIEIGASDYGVVYLERSGDRLKLIRYNPLDYEYMDDYMSDRVDIMSEWRDAVYNGDTEDSYEEYRNNYSYDYDDYFSYDSDTGEYYEEDEDWMTWDWFPSVAFTKEQVIERVIDYFDDGYMDWNFEWAEWMNENVFREKIGEVYDICREYLKQQEEAKKPHWKAFSYYK